MSTKVVGLRYTNVAKQTEPRFTPAQLHTFNLEQGGGPGKQTRKAMKTWIVLVWLTAMTALGQCPDPPLTFQDNYFGDNRYVIYSWSDPVGCLFFLEGTRQLDPDPATDPTAPWFTLAPTFYFRTSTFTNGMYRIGPLSKRVIIDMENFSEPGSAEGLSYPFAPQCWFVRPKLYSR